MKGLVQWHRYNFYLKARSLPLFFFIWVLLFFCVVLFCLHFCFKFLCYLCFSFFVCIFFFCLQFLFCLCLNLRGHRKKLFSPKYNSEPRVQPIITTTHQWRGEVLKSRCHNSKISGWQQTKNVTSTVNSHCFKIILFNFIQFKSNIGKFSRVESERTISKFRKRKGKFCVVFIYSIKWLCDIRSFMSQSCNDG